MIVSDERVARFVSERCGFGLCPPYVALGTESDGQIINGVVFSCFEGADVRVTIAGRGWTKSFLWAVGCYVFDQLGCERMSATTEQEPVVKLACKLGGQVEGLLRNHFGKGRDAHLVGILRSEWKFGKLARE